jgi:hypothetical protein
MASPSAPSDGLLLLGGGGALPPVPSRAVLCAVQTSFQGLAVDLPSYGRVNWFDPFILGLPMGSPDREAVYRAKRTAGDTHCLVSLSLAYANDQGFTFPTPGYDFTNDLPGFCRQLDDVLRHGFWPVVSLSGDGQTYQPDGGTYGWRWVMDHMAWILDGLEAYVSRCVFFHGYELITNGGWSPDNFEQAISLLRYLIPTGVIACHIGTYTWWGDAAGQSGGPVGDWSGSVGMAIDVCMEEGDAPFVDANGNPLDNEYADGWQQRAVAHLGDAANFALIAPKNRIEKEWVIGTPRGPRACIALELDEYRWSRNIVSLDEILRERAYLKALGFQYVG